MRYPVGQLGTKEEYDKFWYDAQGFGVKTDYGYHDGCDINLKSGGDSDLGQLLYAVGDGKIVYYHDNSHPTTGFGKHMVLYCQTPLGDRWYHYAHCQEITATVKEVKRGDVIGKLGKTGTQYAHLHFSVFKVDPKTLRSGIDTIAKTITELNSWWEDPFVTLNMEEKSKELPDWFKTLLQERGLSLDREGEFRDFWEKAIKYDKEITDLREQIKRLNEIINFFPNQEIRFKVGIETFDNNYRTKILKKNFLLNDYTQLSNFYSCCLLICTEGQTKEQISNDIETALKYFKEITINVFINNNTEITRNEELVKWFLTEKYPLLLNKKNIEILIDNKDLGVYVQ